MSYTALGFRKVIPVLFFIIGIFLLNFPTANAQPRLLYSQSVDLFNGRNLNGWYKFLKGRRRDSDPHHVFTVKDGIIHISGTEKGCIITGKEYANYKLIIEYKYDIDNDSINTPSSVDGVARDGGVLLNSTGADGAYSGIWMHSIEVNIIEGGTGDFIVVGDGSDRYSITAHVAAEKQAGSYLFQPGSDYLATIYRGRINWLGRDPGWKNIRGYWGKDEIEYPLGNWNRLECMVEGDEITVYLNGKLVNRAIDVKPAKGKIQIQSEAAPMLIRKIKLIPLEPPSVKMGRSPYTKLFSGKNLEGWTVYGTEKWYVDKDRTLVCESGPDRQYGYLGTKKKYKNFVLTCRFLQEADGNSGVFFHSSIKGTRISGFQAEVASSGMHSGGIYESYGSGWLAIPDSSKESALKVGAWNAMKIRVRGDTVDTWLNGAYMIHLVDKKIGEQAGQIVLQIHAGGDIKVRWKDIWIKEL